MKLFLYWRESTEQLLCGASFKTINTFIVLYIFCDITTKILVSLTSSNLLLGNTLNWEKTLLNIFQWLGS